MRTIFKYPLRFSNGSPTGILMPAVHRVVHFAMQAETPYIWAEVDTNSEPSDVFYVIVGTGHPTPLNADYVATLLHGEYVWHLYWF
jgi:hypothetical protein